jgi:CHAD domain-containing protein
MSEETQAPTQEIEAKFAIRDAAQVITLCTTARLARQFHLGSVTTVRHVDTYVDTPAFALLRRGYTLRIRQTPAGPRITVKGLALLDAEGLPHRTEIEEVLTGIDDTLAVTQWPAEIRTLVEPWLTEDISLHPLCTIHQIRHKRAVTIPNVAEPLAELSIDEVAIYGPGVWTIEGEPADPAQPTTPLNTFWEAEVEVAPGQGAAQLRPLVAQLQRTKGLRPLRRSKLERALEVVYNGFEHGEQRIEHLLPHLHMADACRLIWRQQLAQLVLNEAGVRYSDDIEYVHDLRVAIRRTRTALRLFAPYFRRRPLRAFRKALRTTGRKLGAVRDRDVALHKLHHFQPSTETMDTAAVRERWQVQRAAAFSELVDWLDSAEYAEFIATFAAFCARPGKGARRFRTPAGSAPRPHHVSDVLPTMLVDRFGHVRAFAWLFGADEPLAPETLHQLRIQCKFLRYNLEFARYMLGPSGTRLVNALKALQEHLGELNDAAVTQQLLDEVGDTTEQGAVDPYYAAQTTLIEQRRGDVQRAFERFIGPASRRQLAQAIARI